MHGFCPHAPLHCWKLAGCTPATGLEDDVVPVGAHARANSLEPDEERVRRMRVSVLTLCVVSVIALAQTKQPGVIVRPGGVDIDRPVAITVHLGTENSVSFRLSQRVVTEIDLRVRRVEYSVSLQCAGGLRDVDFGTVELWREKGDDSFSLLFEMGDEQSRKFGKLPRVQLGFSRGRLADMLVETRTNERSSVSSKLCANLRATPRDGQIARFV